MALDRRQFGFWRNVVKMSMGQLVGIEGVVSAVVGVTAAVWLARSSELEMRREIASDFLALGSALVGVVFAGFALVIALLSDRYLSLLQRSSSGLIAFLAPFMVNIGALVFMVVSAVAYRAAADEVPPAVEEVSFGVLCVIFLYAALNIVALARTVLAHGATRAEQAVVDELERTVESRRENDK